MVASTHLIKFLLKDFKCKVFEHSPYLPDLAISDYHLFPRLKKELGGQWFATHEAFIAAVGCTLKILDGHLYHNSTEKLFSQLDKFLQKNIDYLEKCSKFYYFFNKICLKFFGPFLDFSVLATKLLDCPHISNITHNFYNRTANLKQNFEKLNLHKFKKYILFNYTYTKLITNFGQNEKPEIKFEKI